MAIQIKGYDMAFENAVYTRDTAISDGEKAFLGKGVILLARYTEPTEDDVVNYLQGKAKALEARAGLVLSDDAKAEGLSELEKALVALPQDIIRELSRGDEACIKFVRNHTSAPAMKEGAKPDSFLHVKYGIIPAVWLEKALETGDIKDAGWYEAALRNEKLRQNGLGQLVMMQILAENNALPDQDEMRILLKHGAHASRSIEIAPARYNTELAGEVLKDVYAGVSNSISSAPDISAKIAEGASAEAVNALMKIAMKRAMIEEMQGGKGPVSILGGK